MKRRNFIKTILLVGTFLSFLPCHFAIAGVSLHGASTNDSWRFVVISDTHKSATDAQLTDHILADAVTDIVNVIKPDFVILAGDTVEGYSTPAYTLYNQLTIWLFPSLAPLYSASIPVYAVRGNHEACHLTDPITGWLTAWATVGAMPTNGPSGEGGLTYSFTHNNALFIIFDQMVNIAPSTEAFCIPGGTTSDSSVNQTWINAQLAANTSKHIFVISHVQMFDYDTWGGFYSIAGSTLRNAFWDSLVNAHADAFIGGHSHVFNFSQITKSGDAHSVYQIIEGAGRLGDVTQSYTCPNCASHNSPYTLNQIAEYHGDATAPTTAGLALGYLVVEVHGKGTTEPSVTYTWKHAVWNTGTSHWTFSNYYYYKYTK